MEFALVPDVAGGRRVMQVDDILMEQVEEYRFGYCTAFNSVWV